MRPRPLLLAAPLLCAAACAEPATPANPPVSVVAMPPIVAEPPPPDPTQPLSVPRSAAVPGWREEPVAAPKSPLGAPTLVEAGQKAALVRTGAGEVFVVHEDRGVMGPIPLPEGARWIGTDDRDRVYAATSGGELWVAEGPDEAVSGKLVRTGEVKGASDWDFTAGMVAAVRGDEVLVSLDRGASFKASSPRRRTTVRSVFARFDGALAARLEIPAAPPGMKGPPSGSRTEVYLSRDRGRSWQRSAFTPASIRRDGAFIWSGDRDCPAVLSADGRGFTVDQARQEQFSSLPSWSGLLHGSTIPRATPPRSRLRVTSPLPPPSITGKGQTAPARCNTAALLASLEGGVVGGVVGGLTLSGRGEGSLIGALGRGPACKGVACLAGTVDSVPEPTRTGLAFFDDAVCQDAAPGGGGCAAGSPLVRPPHVARIDRVTGKVGVEDLPPGCAPARLEDVGGLGLLLCKASGGGLSVLTRTAGGSWAAEGSLAVRSEEIWATTQSPDGTLMLHASCPQGAACRTLVRAPRPAGDATAWREVAIKGAIAYRVLDEGGALAVVAKGEERRFSLVLATPGAEPGPLGHDVDAGDRDLRDLRVDGEGHVVVSGTAPASRTGSWRVTLGGTLDPLPAPPATGRPTRVRPRPMDPARVH